MFDLAQCGLAAVSDAHRITGAAQVEADDFGHSRFIFDDED
jgi:hypothetical protein